MTEGEELKYLEECICNSDCFDVQTWKTFVWGRSRPCLENNQAYREQQRAALERKHQAIEVITLDDDDTTVGEPAYDSIPEQYGASLMNPNMTHYTEDYTGQDTDQYTGQCAEQYTGQYRDQKQYMERRTREAHVIDVITINDED
ncbi:unnamed protein product [Auanema sp. JU1783]|nr:unnamed protein product [Auanema sp. JU1783]